MDYKDSLNLPKTDFPMKANLPEREPDFLKRWEDEQIYQKLQEKNKDQNSFILHDGPPYANGNIHFGHILNKVLKDIIVKYKSMNGFYSPYVPGWDCHGLPIELGALKELSKKEKDKEKIANPLIRREACRNYAYRFVNEQKDEFKRLGIFSDWDQAYLTLLNQYEADIAFEFSKLYNEGYVYKGKKPVHWCPSCRTALAEAEVEYEDLSSPSIYVKFPIKNQDKLGLNSSKQAYFVIWTTTPWTLPANLALALGENFEYSAFELDDDIIIFAKDLETSVRNDLGLEENLNELKTFKGSELSDFNLDVEHPFIKRKSQVVLGHHVSLESGTGIVHIAPGHGQDDYIIGQKNNLETICPIDEAGRYVPQEDWDYIFDDPNSWDMLKTHALNPKVIELLHRENILLSDPSLTLKHSYPHCWRCKKAILFRATEQWFLSLEHKDLRKKTLKTITGPVKWIPSWGEDRIYGMIENRPDWCLSRQRIWGVPIPIHHCRSCNESLLTEDIANYIYESFVKEGADAWWKDDKALLPEGTTCPHCSASDFQKERSILDVWFDSGVSHAAVLKRRDELRFPADLYLEGSDQHRGWFHSSLLTSMCTNQEAPYKEVLTHGFVVDGQGKKYSKSAKNYLPPDQIINKLGAELLRLWVAAEDYRNDIRVSDQILKVLSEVYRKIRNTCRFILGNLYDFNPDTDSLPYEERTELDRYALSLCAELVLKIRKAYENYEFHQVHHSLNKFFTVDLSALYLDILKDRLYCNSSTSHLRRSAQSTIFDILHTVLPLMAPILSFTSEEIWGHLPKFDGKSDSIFLAPSPEVPEIWFQKDLRARWERIGIIRDEILKVLEDARRKKEIGHPLDAKVILSAEGECLSFLKEYENDWTQICICSQVEIKEKVSGYQLKSDKIATLKVSAVSAEGEKCDRCWNYFTDLGSHSDHPSLCERCTEAVVS